MGIKFDTSDETCAYVREQTDKVILAFSRGKDSIAAWLQILKFWTPEQIIPVYQSNFTGPDGRTTLTFAEESLSYYERKLGTRIYRLAHVQTLRMLYYQVFQSPNRRKLLEQLVRDRVLVAAPTSFMNERVRMVKGLENAWIAVGIRANDSLQRRTHIIGGGSAWPDRKKFYPTWDWSIEQLTNAIKDAGLFLPADYAWFGRSRDSIDARITTALHQHEPESHKRILEWFPEADTDRIRMIFRKRLLAGERGQP